MEINPCPDCEFENETGSAFCIQCGHDFTAAPGAISADVRESDGDAVEMKDQTGDKDRDGQAFNEDPASEPNDDGGTAIEMVHRVDSNTENMATPDVKASAAAVNEVDRAEESSAPEVDAPESIDGIEPENESSDAMDALGRSAEESVGEDEPDTAAESLNDVVDAISPSSDIKDNVAEGEDQERDGSVDLQRAPEEHAPNDKNEKNTNIVTHQDSTPDTSNASTLEGGSGASSELDEGATSELTNAAAEDKAPVEHGSGDGDDASNTVPEKNNETLNVLENAEPSPQSQATLVSTESRLLDGQTDVAEAADIDVAEAADIDVAEAADIDVAEAADILEGLPEAPLDGPLSPLQFSDAGQAAYGERWWLNPSNNPLMPGESANTAPVEIVGGLNSENLDPTLPNGLTPAHVPGRAAVELNRRQLSEVPTIADEFGSGRKNLMIVALIVVAIITILLVR